MMSWLISEAWGAGKLGRMAPGMSEVVDVVVVVVVVVVVQEMSVMKSQIYVDIYGKCCPTHFVI